VAHGEQTDRRREGQEGQPQQRRHAAEKQFPRVLAEAVLTLRAFPRAPSHV
jgi:hypothetical protein